MKTVLKLEVEGEFQISGRRTAIVVDLVKNGYDNLQNKDLGQLFMGKLIEYKEKTHTIIGIEMIGWDTRHADKTSFLLKEYK